MVMNFICNTITCSWNKINTTTGLFLKKQVCDVSVCELGILTVVVLRLWDVSQVAGSTQSGALRWGLSCIVVLCSQSLEAAAVPALLIRLIVIKHTNNYYPTPISADEPLLTRRITLRVRILHSQLRSQIKCSVRVQPLVGNIHPVSCC